MIQETMPSGLVILRDKPEPKPQPVVEESDGSIPLTKSGGDEWLTRLTPEQKDELLSFLPKLFLRCGRGVFGDYNMADGVWQLRARAKFLSGMQFEELT